MPLKRQVEPETLDGLSPDEPSAIRSRADLRRVNRVMGNGSIIRDALDKHLFRRASAPLRILELGAGDGSLLLAIAKSSALTTPVAVTLLDRQALVSERTVAEFARAGWAATQFSADVMEWADDRDASETDGHQWDCIVANLFLHHFSEAQLKRLLGAAGRRSRFFFACEPRRTHFALAASHLIGALGVNAVTRNDAVLSVQAGFCGDEVSALWPADGGWQVTEYSAGLFSHCFSAVHADRPARAP